jgi:hypothetical protein
VTVANDFSDGVGGNAWSGSCHILFFQEHLLFGIVKITTAPDVPNTIAAVDCCCATCNLTNHARAA